MTRDEKIRVVEQMARAQALLDDLGAPAAAVRDASRALDEITMEIIDDAVFNNCEWCGYLLFESEDETGATSEDGVWFCEECAAKSQDAA